ncbi:amidase [Candidatus Babeliales bacterium]|nr:amidase [Candidatus Babeliales bacterium]
MKNSFLDLSIKQILNKYSEGTFDSVDVAKMCIDHVNSLEKYVHSWVKFDSDHLLSKAHDSLDNIKRGIIRSLEGIPIGVKDIFNTVDFTTEMGSSLWKGFTPGNDARVVFELKEAGGIIPGKTTTAEFAVHALDKTLNPHDSSRTPGTSSSGSAVATALGMVPAALATQTAGSIVRPASFCGIYGFKPSFGLIPRKGVLKTTDTLDSIGFFVTHLEDITNVFNILRVKGRDYPLSNFALNDISRQSSPINRPWRVAFVRTHVDQFAESYAKESLNSWLKHIQKNCKEIEIDEINLPEIMNNAHEVHSTIYYKSLAYYFQKEYVNRESISSIMSKLINKGNLILNESFKNALVIQEEMVEAMDSFFDKYDILVSLSTAGVAPLRSQNEKPDTAFMWTMTYLPIISAPAFVSDQGLPFGVQLVSKRYNDFLLIRFAENLLNKGLLSKGPNPLSYLIKQGNQNRIDTYDRKENLLT